MADIHVLKGGAPATDRTVVTQVIFHFQVPAGDQVAEASQDTSLGSVVPDIGQAERSAIEAGEIIEEAASIRWHPSQPNAEVAARLRAKWTARQPKAIAEYKARYRGYLSRLNV